MDFFAEGRLSDSPYIEAVWRGQATEETTLMCPADGRWNIQVSHLSGKTSLSIESPLVKSMPKTHQKGIEWVVIKLKLGVFFPLLSGKRLLNESLDLSVSDRRFWLNGFHWQYFNFENAEQLIQRLMRHELLLQNPVVRDVVRGENPALAARSIRYHFAETIGIPPTTIQQIERAKHATTLLQQGIPILDVVEQTGYADQSHLTRSLTRFMGYTPTQTPQYNYAD